MAEAAKNDPSEKVRAQKNGTLLTLDTVIIAITSMWTNGATTMVAAINNTKRLFEEMVTNDVKIVSGQDCARKLIGGARIDVVSMLGNWVTSWARNIMSRSVSVKDLAITRKSILVGLR
jgi:hypothetical protein